jgi:hypothetical protein
MEINWLQLEVGDSFTTRTYQLDLDVHYLIVRGVDRFRVAILLNSVEEILELGIANLYLLYFAIP